MPFLFSLGQHAALKAVQEGFIEGERLFVFLADIYVVTTLVRVGHVYALLHTELTACFHPDQRWQDTSVECGRRTPTRVRYIGDLGPGGASVARVWFASVRAGHPRSGNSSGSLRVRQCPVIGDHETPTFCWRGFLLFLMFSQLGFCCSIVQGRVLITCFVSFILSWYRASLNDTQLDCGGVSRASSS